ncbi:hypothetical protein [Sphingomonas kyeonggiensis]|uniref:Uncharacterized protein n=1 Tax=Sphingomonas kyeonggiensis TaxID=1268553 RepID=A0A7W6NX38_9SPHN|nr:hypothetical protein [Sphingomonas kyeonggiensis]MBB4099784.1 hypothetical protein [Sphingomonas kyeonggiensis]
MYQQHIPVGPDAGKAPTSKIDRTQLLDPAQYWPDATKCPDWPLLTGTMRYDGERGQRGAERRLETIGQYLNRAPGELRSPTAEEREEAFAKMFRRTGSNWHALGILNLSPLGMMVEAEAGLIVEACHLRGYLRKLQVAADHAVEAARRAKQAEARRTLEDYRATAPAEIEEFRSLAEAVARHQQRLDDERAFDRSRALRQHVETLHSAAVQAAHTLGLGVPDAPDFL